MDANKATIRRRVYLRCERCYGAITYHVSTNKGYRCIQCGSERAWIQTAGRAA